MNQPQSGIVPEAGPAAHFLVLSATDLARDAGRIAAKLATLGDIEGEVASVVPDAGLRSVVSFGAELWERVSPGVRPRELRAFSPIGAGPLVAPATGGDVLLHVHANRTDAAFELARRVRVSLGELVRPLDEVAGFRYLDGRDLTGFIDGTENPAGDERPAAALIGDEDPSFAGGSYVTSHRYVHDLARWSAIPVAEQERIVGRTKPDSRELDDDVRPASSHVSRVVIEEHGEELQILRHSFPYGTTSEHGLLFIAYCRTLSTFEKMLHRMYGTSGDGAHDRLMEFTRAVSGGYFFAPSAERLRGLA
ncbi:MAG: Dyp-type peroxidase [Deltaproteobacteria bacterium]|nr:Dyp-type peroxidase [Deltaproteobacteria bacterium]